MRHSLAFVLLFALAAPVGVGAADKMSKRERKELEAWIKGLDSAKVHKIVTAVRDEPLSDFAKVSRPGLLMYFEDVDYTVCLDQFSPVLKSENPSHEFVWFQVIFSSGDFVLQHPDKARDKEAYMLAGLEGALQAYEKIVATQPATRHPFLDDLVSRRENGKLIDHVRAHMCE